MTDRAPAGSGSLASVGEVTAPRTKRAEQAEATRRALVTAARELFVEKGYGATGTDEIVARAGVGTRGALYHHFADKQALFEAVFEAVETELTDDISRRLGRFSGDEIEHLRSRVVVFLDTVVERPDVRALLIEGPAALGWRRFRAIELSSGAEPIRGLLDRAVEAGTIAAVPTDRLALLVIAAVDAAALEIAESDGVAEARAEVGVALDAFLAGLRTAPVGG